MSEHELPTGSDEEKLGQGAEGQVVPVVVPIEDSHPYFVYVTSWDGVWVRYHNYVKTLKEAIELGTEHAKTWRGHWAVTDCRLEDGERTVASGQETDSSA